MRVYKCTRCKQETERSALTVVRVTFCTMGERFKVLRSRTTAWLCDRCRDEDQTWKSEANSSSPGNAKVSAR